MPETKPQSQADELPGIDMADDLAPVNTLDTPDQPTSPDNWADNGSSEEWRFDDDAAGHIPAQEVIPPAKSRVRRALGRLSVLVGRGRTADTAVADEPPDYTYDVRDYTPQYPPRQVEEADNPSETIGQPEKLPLKTLQELFAATDNTEAFDQLLNTGSDHIAALTLAYYMRPSFNNGTEAPSTLPEDHPLRQKIQTLELDNVPDPAQREVFTSLQTHWTTNAEGPVDDSGDETVIAARLMPSIIAEYPTDIAADALSITGFQLESNDSESAAVTRQQILEQAAQKLDSADTRSEPAGSRLQLAVEALKFCSTSAATEAMAAGFGGQAVAIIESAPGIGTPSPATSEVVGEIINSPIDNFRKKVLEQFLDNIPKAYQTMRTISESSRMQKIVKNPSEASADFLDVVYNSPANPQLFDAAVSKLMSEAYSQASRVAGTEKQTYYVDRIKKIADDLAELTADKDTNELYTRFIGQTPSMSSKTETHALRTFKALSRLGLQDVEDVSNLTAIDKLLVDELYGKHLDGGEELSEQQRMALLERFGSIEPLVAYSLQYKHKDEYKVVLAELITSVSNGEYETWRRGDGSAESLSSMVALGYLPKDMTPSQYAEWCNDSQTSSIEQLMASTGETATAVREAVAAAHADISAIAGGYSLDLDGLEQANGSKAALGRLKGALNKAARGQSEGPLAGDALDAVTAQLGDLSERPEVRAKLTALNEGRELGDVKEQIEAEASSLEQFRLLMRLANVRPEEIAAGALLNQKAKDSKRAVQQELSKVLATLQESLPPELQFIPESVGQLLADSAIQLGESQELTVQDTIDPQVTLEIGENPQRTCQNYDSGTYNAGLIGYFGPEVKITVVRNESGNIIARNVLRVMEDSDGKAVLLAEPIYQSVVSSKVKSMLEEHTAKKAAAMGVRLLGSLAGETDGREKETLQVRKLKMPAVYSDLSADDAKLRTGSLTVTA